MGSCSRLRSFRTTALRAVDFSCSVNLRDFGGIINLNKLVIFVVAQKHVITRQVFFYQVVFQHQGFRLGIANDVFQLGDGGDKVLSARLQSVVLRKIRPRAIAQIFGFADINNLTARVFKKIHARIFGEGF